MDEGGSQIPIRLGIGDAAAIRFFPPFARLPG